MVRDIDVLNEEMEAAGARFFAGGLQSTSHAKSLHKRAGGEVAITDGPYLVRPRNTLAAFGYSTQPTWRRPWRGDAKPSLPAAHRSRCASSSQCQQNRNSYPRTRRLK
jgi:hypothetical protein